MVIIPFSSELAPLAVLLRTAFTPTSISLVSPSLTIALNMFCAQMLCSSNVIIASAINLIFIFLVLSI